MIQQLRRAMCLFLVFDHPKPPIRGGRSSEKTGITAGVGPTLDPNEELLYGLRPLHESTLPNSFQQPAVLGNLRLSRDSWRLIPWCAPLKCCEILLL